MRLTNNGHQHSGCLVKPVSHTLYTFFIYQKKKKPVTVIEPISTIKSNFGANLVN